MRFVAGRGAVAKRLVRGGAVAERHLEDDGRGAVAKRLAGALWRRAIGKQLWAEVPMRQHREETAGRGAVAKRLAGAPWRRAIGKQLRAEVPSGSIGKRLLARPLWKSKAAIAEEQRRPVRPADGKYFRADCQRADGKRLVRRLPPAGIRIRRRFLPGS